MSGLEVPPESDADTRGVLRTLGTFRIWSQIIFLPIIVLLCAGGAVNMQYTPTKPVCRKDEKDCVTPTQQKWVTVALAVFAIVLGAWWFVVLHFRKNPMFQNLEGVSEGVAIASDLMGRA